MSIRSCVSGDQITIVLLTVCGNIFVEATLLKILVFSHLQYLAINASQTLLIFNTPPQDVLINHDLTSQICSTSQRQSSNIKLSEEEYFPGKITDFVRLDAEQKIADM